jgi:hypothetical protein
MNPDMIDGIRADRDAWAARNVALALRAEAIVRRLDPRRIIYHHASGNLGVMHNSNFYPNFVPVQELDDWFEHWATAGVKPAFTCEYGAPFTWDWTMYRGWFKGQREWGSAKVPWEFCLAEWNAQFLGDSAYQISESEKANLRWEARQFRSGNVWHRWDYPNPVGSDRFDERYPVFARYITDNWRAFRTWGVSGVSPWEFEHFWKRRPGVDTSRTELGVDWATLQRPGFSPDFLDKSYERMDLAFERADWIATPAAQALIRNNRPILAYIAGKSGAVTSKDHNFLPGEVVEKQIIVINNSRETVTCDAAWSIDLVPAITGRERESVPTGDQARIPIRVQLPETMEAGRHELRLTATFSTGEVQHDRFGIDVLPVTGSAAETAPVPRLALFDPAGETTKMLDAAGIRVERIEADADLSSFEILVVGKSALTLSGPAPDIRRVRDGLKVIVFEQSSEVLEKRLGFRVVEHGLRQVFPRVPDHPVLVGIQAAHLRDWRGSATILPPRLKYEMRPQHGPTIEWAGIPVTRVWRCGNRGNVASVVIEKPARGDFLPLVDGGFSLQFSPLIEHREGKGMVFFCQLDVTGRTEPDPAGEKLLRNLFRHVTEWRPAPSRRTIYAGGPAGREFLASIGIAARALDVSPLSSDDLVVVGPGAREALGESAGAVVDFLKSGGRMVALGLGQDDIQSVLPFDVRIQTAEHIASFFEPLGNRSPLAGIGPADVHNRDPRDLPLISSGAQLIGDGVLATALSERVVFIQITPWQFQGTQSNLRRTFRRTSALGARVLANMGAAGTTPLLDHFSRPVNEPKAEKRWLDGLYPDQPEEWDDPYRFFRW